MTTGTANITRQPCQADGYDKRLNTVATRHRNES
jgi:hypothetical protein